MYWFQSPRCVARALAPMLALALGAFANPAEAQAALSRIVVFGDSYADDGGANGSQAITRSLLAPAGPVPVDAALGQVVLPDTVHYWHGRWSNGPTAVEVLARDLGRPLEDYAVGGARTDGGNYYAWIDPRIRTGVQGQLARYRAALHGQAADAQALYVIQAGANDLFAALDARIADSRSVPLAPAEVTALADQAAANLIAAVRTLHDIGARQVLVIGPPDLAALPWARGRNLQSSVRGPVVFVDESRRFGAGVGRRLAAQLPALGAQLRMQLVVFDLAAAAAAIQAAAPRDGLRNFTDPCQPGGADGRFAAACAEPDAYWFWDEYHPSRRAAERVAAALEQALQPLSASRVLP